MINKEIKKPKQQELADYLGVSVSSIKQYNPKKRFLMIQGLWRLKETELQKNKKDL